MSGLSVPLAVRLRTAAADQHVTHQIRDLSLRESVPGGFSSATLSLSRPLSVQPAEIGYYGSLIVYDRRSGEVVWEGRLEDVGRGVGNDGQTWRLAAVGPSAHARDRTVPLIYVDRNLANWQDAEVAAARTGSASIPSDAATPAFHFQYANAAAVVANTRSVKAYPLLRYAGQKLARFDYSWTSGAPSVDWRLQAVTRGGASGAATTRDNALNAASGGAAPKVITTDFANDRDWLEVRMLWQAGATTVSGDTTWVESANLCVLATRYGKDGAERTDAASYLNNFVFADQVVADLLGRLLPGYDGAGAVVDTSAAHHIDQLAYPDGVTAAQVLADMAVLEPAYYWAAWEANAAGKYRFEYVKWPTTVRYEAGVADGFDSPASADGLYNAVRVRFRDAAAAILTRRRTQTVAELDAVGLTREAFVDLGDEVGSAANADQVGDQFLADHRYAPSGGTLLVSRPILDLQLGRMVDPWQIKAGSLIRVRGVSSRVDALNATARDGVAVFRLVGRDYAAATNTARLELDGYPPTVARALADLQSRPVTRRR